MKLYLFDFDGTLYKKDSMIDFLKHLHNNIFKYYFLNLLFLPVWFLKALRFINIETYKSIFLKIHLKNYSEKKIFNCSKFFSKKIYKNLFPGAKEYLKSIDGEKCIISSSVDIWMDDISKELGVELICTESVFKNKKFDRINKNCNYSQKLIRVKEKYDLNFFDNIFIFGNSKGDYEMYKLGTKHHKYFN